MALDALAVRVTVQLAVPGEFTVAGGTAHTAELSDCGQAMVACWLTPLKVAVTVALWLLLKAPEVAGKVALLCPGAMLTPPGTASDPLLLASETVAALVAALFRVNVQVLDALLPRVEGAQTSDVSCGVEERWRLALRSERLRQASPSAGRIDWRRRPRRWRERSHWSVPRRYSRSAEPSRWCCC